MRGRGARPNKPDRAYGGEEGARVWAARCGSRGVVAVCFTKAEGPEAGTAKLVQAGGRTPGGYSRTGFPPCLGGEGWESPC